MGENLVPGSNEGTRIQNPELAEEMARAEIEPREKMEAAQKMGLSEESIRALGLEVDEAAERRKIVYEKAMQQTDNCLLKLLQNPSSEVFQKFDDEAEEITFYQATRPRVREWVKDPETGQLHDQDKIFTIRGRHMQIIGEAAGTHEMKFYFKKIEDI